MNTKKEEREDTKKKEKKKVRSRSTWSPRRACFWAGWRTRSGPRCWCAQWPGRPRGWGRVRCGPAGAPSSLRERLFKTREWGTGNRESGIGGCWRWWDWGGPSRCAMGDVPILSCVCAIESYGWKCPINPLWVCLSGSCLALSKKTWLSQRILVRGPWILHEIAW